MDNLLQDMVQPSAPIELLRFQLVRPLASSEGDAHNRATDIKSDLNLRTFNRS